MEQNSSNFTLKSYLLYLKTIYMHKSWNSMKLTCSLAINTCLPFSLFIYLKLLTPIFCKVMTLAYGILKYMGIIQLYINQPMSIYLRNITQYPKFLQ